MHFAREESKEDGKNFLKLKDGDSVTGVFRGNLYEFDIHWVGNRSQECTGPECDECMRSKKKFRFRLNFVTKENGVCVPKIFEQGWKVYRHLKAVHADYNLEKTIVKISRKGSGTQDTSYTIMPVPQHQVPDALEKQLQAVQLHDLKAVGGDKPGSGREPGMDDFGDVPF